MNETMRETITIGGVEYMRIDVAKKREAKLIEVAYAHGKLRLGEMRVYEAARLEALK